MNFQTMLACWGGLIHDLGKMVFRAGGSREIPSYTGAAWLQSLSPQWVQSKDMMDCLRFHHREELQKVGLSSDSPAYVVYLADTIATAADRNRIESDSQQSFDCTLPLSPVFTHMKGEHSGKAIPLQKLDGSLRMPVILEQSVVSGHQYQDLLDGLKDNLSALPKIAPEYLDPLLVILETWTSMVPASIYPDQSPDISLYDHLKITGAAAACISEYLLAQQETDYCQLLLHKENDFRKINAFLLYSADFSGIQKFIYTVAISNALRSLRSRSFFLELAMEHYIDELLSLCGVCRANLLYSGGGHCYLLLPNTDAVRQALAAWNSRFNDWLIQEFGSALYLADGWTECSANDLTNIPAAQAPYQQMFRRVSQAIAEKKVHRYSLTQLLALNSKEARNGIRECRICGRSDVLVPSRNGESLLCPWCRRFEDLSEKILYQQVLTVSSQPRTGSIPLPCMSGEVYLDFSDEKSVQNKTKDSGQIQRIYTINQFPSTLRYSTRLFVGNYSANNRTHELATQSEGITRLGICRMDVDDLGQAFVSGFERPEQTDAAEKLRYVTISRTAAFSRQISLFFKFYINPILSGSYEEKPPLSVSIVYSGGDDVFLMGAWDDTIEAAQRIQQAFRDYTCGALTISGGIGLFTDRYPIRFAAYQTAELEDASKNYPGKDAITLFDTGTEYTYHWQEFYETVVKEKLALLQRFFCDSQQNERGNAFLYNLMNLLQAANQEGGKLPLAQYAYLLTRLEPARSSPNRKQYKEFSDKMYRWSLHKDDRAQLVLAILLHIYHQNREEQNENG